MQQAYDTGDFTETSSEVTVVVGEVTKTLQQAITDGDLGSGGTASLNANICYCLRGNNREGSNDVWGTEVCGPFGSYVHARLPNSGSMLNDGAGFRLRLYAC